MRMNLKDRCSDYGDGGVAPLQRRACAARSSCSSNCATADGRGRRCATSWSARDNRVLLVGGGISAGRHVVATRRISEPGWWQSASRELRPRLAPPARDRLDRRRWRARPADRRRRPGRRHRGAARPSRNRSRGGFIGASYGGMVALQFAARHPARIGAMLVISAAGAAHPFASACRSLQRRALSLGERGDRRLAWRSPAPWRC